MAAKRTAPKTEQEQMNERLQRSENLLNKLDEDDSKSRKVCGVDYIDSLVDVLGLMKIEWTGRACYIRTMDGKNNSENILAEPPLPYIYLSENPAPEMVSHLVNLYFVHVHPYVPIIHKSDFLSRLNDKSNPNSPLLLCSVLAMGARYSDDPNVRLDPAKPETAGLIFYNRAKELLEDFMDAPRLSTVQSQLLMLKFQEGIRRSGFFFRSWLCFGLIIRMAQALGLDRNYDKWDAHISRADMITRKRVWQTCFVYDQFMSGAQGRDFAISLQTAGIELPTKEDFEDEQELQIQTDFVHFVRLTRILSGVISSIVPVGSGSSHPNWSSNPKLQILDTALDAWSQALPSRLRCQQPADNNNGLVPQAPFSHFAGFLNILYHTVSILLHRPYISSMDYGRVSQNNVNHANICTMAANSISQISQIMNDQWGSFVFQYPIRGGNYGTYCLVAASMIHLVNMSSPDLRFSQPAHDHFLSALEALKMCIEHSAAWDLRDKVQALEAAFHARKTCQPYGLIFHPGSHPGSPGANVHMNRRRPQMPRRRTNMPNVQDSNALADENGNLLSNSFPDNFSQFSPQSSSPPHFHERSLYMLTEDSDHNTLTKNFEFIPPQDSRDENSLLTTPISHIPMAGLTGPIANQFNPLISLDNAKRPFDVNGLSANGTIWDPNSLFLWTNTNGQHIWTENGGISPLSANTPISAASPPENQTPEHGSPYSHGSPEGSAVDPVVVASQNHEEVILTPESVAWYGTTV
ncbi:15667_t:CDS:2 [Acaulospora morrowiae]|uniref:15667_t:CDS:1 n=1 Tax=Acaulospora morrowiae TaxID=94023 RepID=A0A9N9H514_9GLOM|nr:15667_t:CDS:2 [Acaulospora morrowiae]